MTFWVTVTIFGWVQSLSLSFVYVFCCDGEGLLRCLYIVYYVAIGRQAEIFRCNILLREKATSSYHVLPSCWSLAKPCLPGGAEHVS